MPGFITHYICGQATLKAAPAYAQEMIKPYEQLYNLGTQGPDIFFYYLPGLLKKNVRHIGIEMHKHHFSDFMHSMVELLMSENFPGHEEARNSLFAYISGYLTHYSLDATAHPYVYSKTGTRQKGDKVRALKCSVNHRKFETAIDVLMLNLMSGKKPSNLKLWQLIKPDAHPALIAAAAISTSIHDAYDREISPKEVHNAMNYTIRFTRLLQSRTGKRKRLMELIENLTIGENLYSSIIHMQEVNDGVDYMNIQKAPWQLPQNKNINKNESFVDLYNDAVKDSIYMITALCDYLKGDCTAEVLSAALGDRSLSTGIDLSGEELGEAILSPA